MGLPICVCPTGEFALPDGQVIPIRGLTRAEAIQIRAAMDQGVEHVETLTIKAGCSVSMEEAGEWYATAPQDVVERLIDAVARLSGLDPDQGKAEGDSSPSETPTQLISGLENFSTRA